MPLRLSRSLFVEYLLPKEEDVTEPSTPHNHSAFCFGHIFRNVTPDMSQGVANGPPNRTYHGGCETSLGSHIIGPPSTADGGSELLEVGAAERLLQLCILELACP